MKTRRKIEEKNIRKISKTGGGTSYCITLPIDVIRRWGWREHQKVVLDIDDKKKIIKIRDWKKSYKKK